MVTLLSFRKIDTEQENCRIWGEEREENAIWGVYLKKVRYQRPSSIVQIVQSGGNHHIPGNMNGSTTGLNGNYHYGKTYTSSGGDDRDQEEIAHLMWETVRVKVLRAGTLRKVIEAIANDDSDVQATHLSVFLATYRAFASPAQVLREIIIIYRKSTSEELSKAMIDSLNVWLDSYSEDFEPGAEGFDCLQKIIFPFAQEENLTSLCHKVQYKLRSRRKMKKSASVHSLRTYSPLNIKVYSLLSIPEYHCAQQLTYFDKELFLNLRAWECLGGLWKRRCGCGSVVATVEQFNALSGRVVATILLDKSASFQQRAKVLDKWIRISQELRLLKNFSSLKAIISGLESLPVFRLSKVWQYISKDRLAIFSQLSQIFSEENNRMAQRSLLEAEGTAKFPTPSKSPKDKRFLSRMLRGGTQGTGKYHYTENDSPNGTIPYLGTFLTDLTFIDSAIPDVVQNGLINFDKRRKEFEILAQLKLLQGSAKGYRLEEDPYFTGWFNSLIVLDEKAAYDLSLTIQPDRLQVKGHRKTDSFTSNSSSENIDSSMPRKGSIPSSSDSSIQYATANGTESSGGNSSSSGLLTSTPETSVVVKVSSPAKGEVMYKSILVGNSDHTPKVIGLALEKLGLEGDDPRGYNLVQVLPTKELKFPSDANIFYALDTSGVPGDVRLEVRPTTGKAYKGSYGSQNPYHNNNNLNKLDHYASSRTLQSLTKGTTRSN